MEGSRWRDGALALALAVAFALGGAGWWLGERATGDATGDAAVPPRGVHPAPRHAQAVPADRATLTLAQARTRRSRGEIDVVLVTLDTTRADFLEPYGSPVPTSPLLSALARQGVTFTRAHSTAGWTSPSMASLMTGLYPTEHGIVVAASTEEAEVRQPVLPEDAHTLAERMQAEGYRTFGVNTNMLLDSELGFAQGFERYVETDSGDIPFPRLAVESLHGELGASDKYFLWVHYFDPHWLYREQAPWFQRWNDSPFLDAGELAMDAATRAYRWQRGMGAGDAVPPEAVPLLRGFVPFFASGTVSLFDGIRQLAGTPEGPRVVDDYLSYLRAAYRSELRAVDQDLQRVLEGLGVDDQTLLVVTADHGEELLDHGDLGHSMESLYEELIHIPLIVRLPGGRHAGTVVDTPVSIVDVLPSLLELVGAAPADDVSGKSFVELLDGTAPSQRRVVVSELTHRSGRQHRCVIDHPWKYVHHHASGRGELYDLSSDPHEQRDLAATRPERVRELRTWLEGWAAERKLRWPKLHSAAVSSRDLEQLRALGYAGGD